MELKIPFTNWIWMQDWESSDQNIPHLVYFRKSFFIKEDKIPKTLKVRVSADTRYKLYVNGTFVEFGPVKGDQHVWYVDTVEIAPYLRAGENVIAAEVLRYPLNHRNGNHGFWRTNTPGLYVAELTDAFEEWTPPTPYSEKDYPVIAEEDGYGISAGASWKYIEEKNYKIISENPYFAPLQILEDCCGNAELAGWKLPGYDDSQWQSPYVYVTFFMSQAVSPGNLIPRTIPSMKKDQKNFDGIMTIRESVHTADAWNRVLAKGGQSIVIPPHSHETVEINAGAETTGYVSLRMADGASSEIKMLTAESYVIPEDDVRVSGTAFTPKKGDRCDYENGRLHGYTDSYHVNGYGTGELPESYEPFWFRTFRFIQLDIETKDQPLEILGFDYQETGYPLEIKTQVETSDPDMAAIWEISARTLQDCMHETYEDCPFYEQLQYAMDSRNQILYTYASSGDDRLARKCMDDFRRSQRYDGMTNCSYPCFGPNVIPGFSIYYIMMVYDHMMYFGDKQLLSDHMGAIDGVLQYFDNHIDARGLVGKNGGVNGVSRYWSFIDWTAQWDQTAGVPTAILQGPITMESLLYIMGLSAAAEIAEFLGRRDTAREYLARAEAVRSAVRTYCMGSNGMLQDGPGIDEYSQHCQVFAVLTDTITGEAARENLEITLENQSDYAQCSVAMAYYLYRAMEKCGIYEKTGRCWDVWRKMLAENLSTCVEDPVGQRSDCHAWGALALYEIPAVVLGVHPTAPGFAEFAVEPNPGPFDWAKGDVVTPLGMIHVEWKKDESGKVDVQWKMKQ